MGTVFEKQKGSSMKWLGRWLVRVIQKSQEAEPDECPRPSRNTISGAKIARGSDIDSDEGLNITVRQALGGKIVTFRHYDHRTDRSTFKNYVIPEDMDFERELGKMITLESMRG